MLWILLRKDFVRRWRSPASTLVMLAFPFLMAGMIGAVSSGASDGIPAVKILVLDREDGILGNLLSGSGNPPDQDRIRLDIEKVGEEGFARMEKGEASALIVIPENFTDDLLDGRDVSLRIVRNPTETIKPEIVEQGIEVIATYLDVAVKVLGEELGEVRDLLDADRAPSMAVVTALAGEVYTKIRSSSAYLFPPVVEIGSEKEEGAARPNLFGYVLVMVSVMSVLFVAIRAVTDLYEDARTGMLRRQMSTPVSVGVLVASKLLFAVAFGVTVMIVLLVAGLLLGWFQDLRALPWVIVHVAAVAWASGALMTVVVALVKTEKQAGILSWIVVMVMSVAGGSMFPVEAMPAAVQSLARGSLNYWAVEGLLDLLVRGDGTVAAMPATLVLAGGAAVLTLVGVPMMRRRLQEALR